MDVDLVIEILLQANFFSMRAHVRKRRPGRFLHYVPHGTGDLKTFPPGHFRCLNEQDVTPERCPGQSGYHTGDGGTDIYFFRLHENGMPE